MKFIPVALFYFAAEALAGRIQYSTGYTTGGVSGNGGIENKAAGTIPDNKDDLVINNMGTWSNNEFNAKRNARSQVIIVSRVTKVQTKGQAVDANNRAEQIVNARIK
ncbi:hypothetical protein EsDP_00003167 [Epichloe bromicola]|uniref:Uncharacterized protein n=1 Tax=Epichloe bromicola TaxID=79588 RepID=A0ABQ0CN10_9HYPO